MLFFISNLQPNFVYALRLIYFTGLVSLWYGHRKCGVVRLSLSHSLSLSLSHTNSGSNCINVIIRVANQVMQVGISVSRADIASSISVAPWGAYLISRGAPRTKWVYEWGVVVCGEVNRILSSRTTNRKHRLVPTGLAGADWVYE